MKVIKQYLMPFSRAEIFQAWISEQAVVKPVVKIESVPQVGGQYILHAAMGDSVLLMKGLFLEFIDNRKLAYSWNWQHDPETTTVKVEFIDDKEGTRIDLSHEGFVSEESKNLHDQGWDSYIEGLTEHLKKT